jgi:hypothetical protein
MYTWYTNKDYDKPIAMRIIEQEGIPREFFGMLKKNVFHESLFLWPYSANASFRRYLAEQGQPEPSAWVIRLARCLSFADILFYKNTTRRFGLKKGRRSWERFSGMSLLIQWVNSELKKTYSKGLETVEGAVSQRHADVRGIYEPESPKRCQ